MRKGFSTEKYLTAQKKAIEERLAKFSGRLYLEFGGKLLDDFHAARTLPGYDPNAKGLLLKSLKKDLEIVYCISAKQLVAGKKRGDWGIGYDLATPKILEELEDWGLPVLGVVINRYEGEKEVEFFERKLRILGVRVYKRREIEGYPHDLELILSKKGFGGDDYIRTSKPLVVVWGAGPGAGKLSTCLGQIYLDQQAGIDSGYAKFETFPIWNLPLNHPVNVAYEAATADLGDYNLVDPFHLQAYGKVAVNYNRDVESFPILQAIFEKITGRGNFTREYKSPTDMGVNMAKEGIIDEEIVKTAAKKEINFYLFRYREEFKEGLVTEEVLNRMKVLMQKVGIGEDFLGTVGMARRAREEAKRKKGKGEKGIFCGAAIELSDGQIISGKNSPLLFAEAAAVLNSLKVLAKIPDRLKLISPTVIKQINKMKKIVGERSYSLNCAEALLALAVSGEFNPLAERAKKFLPKLRGCFMHTTHALAGADRDLFRKLGIWVSTDGLKEKVGKR